MRTRLSACDNMFFLIHPLQTLAKTIPVHQPDLGPRQQPRHTNVAANSNCFPTLCKVVKEFVKDMFREARIPSMPLVPGFIIEDSGAHMGCPCVCFVLAVPEKTFLPTIWFRSPHPAPTR